MKISCLTYMRLVVGALCCSAFLFLPSHAFSDTCDPVVTGGELSFTDTNCWYQLQDLTTPDYNMCQGNGGSDAMNACPGLTLGHSYSVKKWIYPVEAGHRYHQTFHSHLPQVAQILL